MAKDRGPARTKPAQEKETVRMEAPKGTGAIGLPVGDTVVQFKVDREGFIEAPPGLVTALRSHGFTVVQEDD